MLIATICVTLSEEKNIFNIFHIMKTHFRLGMDLMMILGEQMLSICSKSH